MPYEVRGLPMQIQQRARAKLIAIDAGGRLVDLRVPPGIGSKLFMATDLGNIAFRVNEQWRICFVWRDGDAWEVEIVDYH